MKRPLQSKINLDQKLIEEADKKTKSIIGVGENYRQFLDYLLCNAREAGYAEILIVVGEKDAGVPCLKPTGGHAVYVNAQKFIGHIPQCEFPGQSLVVNLYPGIRATEIGSYMFAYKDPKTGEVNYPDMDLVRLALPRRVYTGGHLDFVAESLAEIYAIRKTLQGMRITENGGSPLRHFVARLEFIENNRIYFPREDKCRNYSMGLSDCFQFPVFYCRRSYQ